MEVMLTASELTAQLLALRKQQIDASDRAIYLGWTAQTRAEYDSRSDLIADLLARLANSNGD